MSYECPRKALKRKSEPLSGKTGSRGWGGGFARLFCREAQLVGHFELRFLYGPRFFGSGSGFLPLSRGSPGQKVLLDTSFPVWKNAICGIESIFSGGGRPRFGALASVGAPFLTG